MKKQTLKQQLKEGIDAGNRLVDATKEDFKALSPEQREKLKKDLAAGRKELELIKAKYQEKEQT